jgi:ribosomal protein L40E
MPYLICDECGKYYKLNEGKSSFNYEKCSCGGKLTYIDTLEGMKNNYIPPNISKITCTNCGAENIKDSTKCSNCGNEFVRETTKGYNQNINGGISWLGVAAGFGFLLTGTLMGVLAIFGTNIPQKVEDIPYNLLIAFGMISMFLAIISGLISSYIGGSLKFKNGIINGGLVGVILGLMVGVTSGSLAFLGVIAIFGSLSVLGGIFGTFLKRRL